MTTAEPNPVPDAADDPRPYRSLCAAILLQAVKDFWATSRDADSIDYREDARRYFFERDTRVPAPFNFAFCCGVLDLDMRAIRRALQRRRMNAFELRRAIVSSRTSVDLSE